MRYLMTQSLLSSWQWLYKARDAYPFDEDKADAAEAKAEADFLRVLRRERGEPSPAMLDGRMFEALCYDIADGRFRPTYNARRIISDGIHTPIDDGLAYDSEHFPECPVPIPVLPKNYPGALQVARVINGGVWQVKLSKQISVGGRDFLLYGILDALKGGVIYDIKYKTRSLGSVDLPGLFADSPQHPMYFALCPEATRFEYLVSDGDLLYTEAYERGDVAPIEATIGDFMEYLNRACLVSVYENHWAART